MNHIIKRVGAKGIEYIFRYDDKLYAFKKKEEAEIKFMELAQGTLF